MSAEIDEENHEETKGADTKIYEPQAQYDDSELSSGEFIFLLDRSASMRGTRIALVKETLEFFLHSLPENSKFNIISFGGSYEKLFQESVKYSEETFSQALYAIKTFEADLGSTNILSPLKAIFRTEASSKFPRNIFLLTDGEVSNPELVVTEIRKYSDSTRVHSFGLGSSSSAYLIIETAKAGKGTSNFIDDGDTSLDLKVIRALREASKP